MEKQQIAQAIKQIELGLAVLKKALHPETQKPKIKPVESNPKMALAESLPPEDLGPTPNWMDASWPEAVPSRLIVAENASLQEKKFRALQIIGMLEKDLSGQNCLDLGCGEGFIAAEIAEVAHVVAYDPTPRPTWHTFPAVRFTADKQEIKPGFDYILCYDVFDHIVGEHPGDLFSWAASLLAPDGTMLVRTHPWTSRHGSHSYEKVNKAYIHLALTAEEMQAANIPTDCFLRLSKPMAAYEAVFRKAGLITEDKQLTITEIDDYFTDELIDRINKVTWKGNITLEMVRRIMRIQFIDYVLRRS